jgi:hypothetical protein
MRLVPTNRTLSEAKRNASLSIKLNFSAPSTLIIHLQFSRQTTFPGSSSTGINSSLQAHLALDKSGMASTSGDLRERYSAIDLETTRVLAEAGATVMDCTLSE